MISRLCSVCVTRLMELSWYRIVKNKNNKYMKGPFTQYLLTAAARIPMLLSLGGIEEWPGALVTLSFTMALPFSLTPILQQKTYKAKSITYACIWMCSSGMCLTVLTADRWWCGASYRAAGPSRPFMTPSTTSSPSSRRKDRWTLRCFSNRTMFKAPFKPDTCQNAAFPW